MILLTKYELKPLRDVLSSLNSDLYKRKVVLPKAGMFLHILVSTATMSSLQFLHFAF